MSKYNNIYFFNIWQNGDIHVSRNFVKIICQVARSHNPECGLYYVHKNPYELLEDIPYIKTIRFDDPKVKQAFTIAHTDKPSMVIGNDLFVNTWYGADRMRHMKKYGITFDCLYDLFDTVAKTFFGASLEAIQPDPIKLFPNIDMHNVPDATIMRAKLETYAKKKILICNGNAISGYAKNVELVAPVIDAFKDRPDIDIFYTNPLTQSYDRELIDISTITTKKYNLLQIGYLSRYFNIIIGRASGASTFSITKENIFNETVTHLAFCKLEEKNPLWFGDRFRFLYSQAIGKIEGHDEATVRQILELYKNF